MQSDTSEKSAIQLEALILQQEHRWIRVLMRFFSRGNYAEDDPRRKACRDALVFKSIATMITLLTIGAVGGSTLIAMIVSVQTLMSIQEQNVIESRAFLFDHARDIQRVLLVNPELYPYFYEGSPVPEGVDEETRVQIALVAEMILDMLDNAAGSRISQLSEGWSEYAQYIHENSPAFRSFYEANKDWYPMVEALITDKTKRREPTTLDWLKDYIRDL